jgi:molybdate transport system substrate-binding protein
MRRLLSFLLPLVLVLVAPGVQAQERTVTVFAAASLKNALDEIGQAYTARSGVRVVVSYASSAALARQIEQGAPAELFISADVGWMDHVAERKLIRTESRLDLLGNSLVLIAPKDSAVETQMLAPYFDLAALARNGRIAVGDVRSVPAGRYAKAALEALGIWASVEKRLAMAENVRAALALVARGETPLGIVYATDAKVEPGVKVIGTFPDGSHPPITYPAALTASAKADAPAFLNFLRSGAARAVFERYGFTVLITPAG